MKRILALLALLAALALSVHPTLAETSVAPEVTPTPGAAAIASPTASPTPEPAGTLYDCTDFRVRLSDDLAPLDDEALAGYAAAVGSAYPDTAEMRLVAAEGGTTYRFFKDLPVTVGAKTGSAQRGDGTTANAVVMCYAPYDDPEIAVAVVVEKGNAGSAIAQLAREVLDAYFSIKDSNETVESEMTLLQ